MFYKLILSIILCGCLHSAANGQNNSKEISTIENGLIAKVQIDSTKTPTYSIAERMKLYHVPGVSITVYKDGKPHWSKSYGKADLKGKVNNTTMFQAASISKAVTGFGVLKLAESYKLDLDKDINSYLRSWKVPENEFTKTEKVTIRRLLNHSAGINVSGFNGYKQTDTFPTKITVVLNGEGNTEKIEVVSIPGSTFSYSGGGYIILQQLVEDISNISFANYMKEEVLQPLGMKNSSFTQVPSKNRSLAFDNKGHRYEGGWYIFPELAAAGLWSTPSDLATFCIAVQLAYEGKNGSLISKTLATEMLKPTNNWGLGLGVRGKDKDAFFFHGGRNPGFNNIIINLFNQGLGIVVMTNGEQGGNLRDEIVRSFAAYYKVRIQPPPRMVKPATFNKDAISEFPGRYQWKENYFLELSISKEGQLVLTDLFDGKVNNFTPTGTYSFIDMNSGEEAILKKNEVTGALSIFYNGIDTFSKVK